MTSESLCSSERYRNPHRVDGRIVAMLALVFALAGCSTAKRQYIVETVPDDYRVAHPIKIDDKLFTMDIPVGLDTARLSTPVKGNILGFAQRFNASDSNLMAIVAPSGSPNQAAAADMSRQVRDVLVNAGIRPGALEIRSYSAGSAENAAPIRLAYNKIAAHVDGCGTWPDHLEQQFRNRNYSNYGCATQANLAAMTDNPLDLVYPRALTPADASRRSTVLDKYRRGEVYAAKQILESGEVAEGVGN